jgi:hypothetical protein
MSYPISCNAWTGDDKVTAEIGDPAEWALQRQFAAAQRLLAPREVDLRNWQDKQVGWGVVLREGAAIPEPIEKLIRFRGGAPIFRYRSGWPYEFVLLRNYEAGKDIDINGAPRGTSPESLPFYLLLVGSPEEIPWKLQYVLNANRCVGRLHLVGRALENYVEALISGKWSKDTISDPNHAVVWAVDHGENDISNLMRNSIAEPVARELRADDQIGTGAVFLDGSESPATLEDLAGTLSSHRPGLVVTTSHGMTGPLNDATKMARDLGLPVDSRGQTLPPEELLGRWQPAGAIWYAHACCSAGGDRQSGFVDLVSRDSAIGRVLTGIAALGSQIAPLPTALLGADQPLRAFIGHVEPTFDWTLQQRATTQFVTASIVDALYGYMYVRKGDVERPIGLAFREWYARTNGLRAQYQQTVKRFNSGEDVDNLLLALQLAARDIESTVILGDPTVAMPGLT